MNKNTFEKKHREYEEKRTQVSTDSWRLHYHIMPDSGWLNDPNGLCQFQGIYHIYYQYSPFDCSGKTKLWGHVTSSDLCSWKQEEPFLFPDSVWDEHGAYSGSAFLHNDQIHFFYTGNVKRFDRDDYDYVYTGREQNTITCTSKDGYVCSEKQLLLSNVHYPDDMSCHVRDPKVYESKGKFYMVLGGRDIHDVGCILVYKSKDLQTWEYCNRLQTAHPFGYMWECPDVFDVDDQRVLITCPQGVKPQGFAYANVHQCGCFLVYGDLEGSYELSPFQQLDFGFDFYAPQTFMDEKGRRILIGWMGLPDITYTNPTTLHGWQHALSIPRELHIKGNKLCQEPIVELQKLRHDAQYYDEQSISDANIKERVYELRINIIKEGSFILWLRNTTYLQYNQGVLNLTLDEEGYGRTTRSVEIAHLANICIYSDTSSLEIFINDGEKVMTSRLYETHAHKDLSFKDCNMHANVVFYKLDGYTFQ